MYALDENSHIVKIIGHSFIGALPVLVLEYCANGDLLTFIRTNLSSYKKAVHSVSSLSTSFASHLCA